MGFCLEKKSQKMQKIDFTGVKYTLAAPLTDRAIEAIARDFVGEKNLGKAPTELLADLRAYTTFGKKGGFY